MAGSNICATRLRCRVAGATTAASPVRGWRSPPPWRRASWLSDPRWRRRALLPAGEPGRGGIWRLPTPRPGLGPAGTAAAARTASAAGAPRWRTRRAARRQPAARRGPGRRVAGRAGSACRPPLEQAEVADPRAAGGRQVRAPGAGPEAGAAADLILAGVQDHQEQPRHRFHLPDSRWTAREPRTGRDGEAAGCPHLAEVTTSRRHQIGQAGR